MENMLPTIIIPAHNEANTIGNTLANLEEGINKFYNIIVVCNGCDDDTYRIASSFKHIQCHSIEIASKAHAIRHAESLNPNFPRLYVDADIVVTANDAKLIFANMQDNLNAGLYVPKSKTNTLNSHFTVKNYYTAWYDTPYVKKLGYGAGAYALNQKGRERFAIWPDLVSDDGFIRTLFSPDEIHIIDTACVEVQAPKTWWQLIRIKARSKYGILELKQQQDSVTNEVSQLSKKTAISDSLHLAKLGLKLNYILINVIAIAWAYWMLKTNKFSWLKDRSNH